MKRIILGSVVALGLVGCNNPFGNTNNSDATKKQIERTDNLYYVSFTCMKNIQHDVKDTTIDSNIYFTINKYATNQQRLDFILNKVSTQKVCENRFGKGYAYHINSMVKI